MEALDHFEFSQSSLQDFVELPLPFLPASFAPPALARCSG